MWMSHVGHCLLEPLFSCEWTLITLTSLVSFWPSTLERKMLHSSCINDLWMAMGIFIIGHDACSFWLLKYVLLPRLHAQWGGTPRDGRHSGNPEAAKDGLARPADALGSLQRGKKEPQTSATGTWPICPITNERGQQAQTQNFSHLCSLAFYTGPDYSPPWDTEDTITRWHNPSPRARHLRPHSPHCWTTLWLQKSRYSPLSHFILLLLFCINNQNKVLLASVCLCSCRAALSGNWHMMIISWSLAGCEAGGNGLFQNWCPGSPQSFKQRHQRGNQLFVTTLRKQWERDEEERAKLQNPVEMWTDFCKGAVAGGTQLLKMCLAKRPAPADQHPEESCRVRWVGVNWTWQTPRMSS